MGTSPEPETAQRPPMVSSLSSASSRRLVTPCWTHDETVALIDAYREKWYALRRGNLRASHWEEVADGVRDRCQSCRHKVEKLRQRYRAEKQRLALRGNSGKPRFSSWVYFRKMDSMELGSTAGDGAIPSSAPLSSSSDDGKDDHNVIGEVGSSLVSDGLKFRIPRALRSKVSGTRPEERTNAPVGAGKPKLGNGFFNGFSGPPRPFGLEEIGQGEQQQKKGSIVWEMVAAVKMLGDEFTRIEEMKMKMARDMEKVRREMELKRTKMILDSQRQIVDYIRGLHEKNGAKVKPKQ
ncbi:unnamed protein product [Spirodela intermedia]|uniref:Myb/SANT-like DNA-binding domain-containing protein n=1 Tax=Spirodela intermedia TaxID=51605 RepID=A0A7I8JA43_SPIIN|nr:unnamed protein product [Spirodela intermedia]CAA6667017.1 unnamed protein product [Spirodela intermedia]